MSMDFTNNTIEKLLDVVPSVGICSNNYFQFSLLLLDKFNYDIPCLKNVLHLGNFLVIFPKFEYF